MQLKGPKQYQLGFDLITVSASDTGSQHYFKKKSSGLYRSGFVVVGMEAVAGTYDLVPSTYLPNQVLLSELNIAKGTTDPRVEFILPKSYCKFKHKP